MKKNLAICFVLVAVIAVSGCGGKIRYPNYYTLNLPAPPDPPAQTGVRASLAVRQFRAPTYLRQGAIVYKTSPEQVGFNAYHLWEFDPLELVTSAILAHLRPDGTATQ